MSATTETAQARTFVQIEEPEPGRFVGCLGQNRIEQLDDLDAAQLRVLAAEAHVAAMWLEAHQ